MPCFSEQKMPDGSWKCEKCNNINYPFRTKCNRQNCGAEKPDQSKKSPSPAEDENDQVCCVIHLACISVCWLILLRLSITHVFTNSISINKMFLIRKKSSPLLSLLSLPLVPSLLFCRYIYLFNCQLYFHYATIDLHLSTVPVSTRTCLRFEKVQGCRPALLNMGV